MRAKYIDKATVEKLRKEIGKEKFLPLRISVETGLRIGDVLSLRYSQFSKKNKVPVITATAQKTKKKGVFPISEGLYKIVKDREKKRKKYPRGDKRAGRLFPSYGHTGHLTRQAAWKMMKRAAEHLGIDPHGISPHSMRKCFAVALRHEQGLEAVKKALQHSNDSVTRVYAYADTVLQFDSDAPILWRDVELIVEYILDRLREKSMLTK